MEILDPSKQAHLYDSFQVVENGIAKGISASRSVAANGHWKKWAKFFIYVALNPLLVSYRDLVPTPNFFSRKYQTGSLTPSGRQVQYCRVKYAMQ